MAAALLLAACSKGVGGTAANGGESAKSEDRIACALAGAREFVQDCTIEPAHADGPPIVVIRHPDGGFRRFTVLPNGGGLVAADGAQEPKLRRDDATIEIVLGDDRYRIPIMVMGNAAKP
jgi:hypothetical protein